MLGCYGGTRVRHAEPRPARGAVGALHQPPHRLAAVHAGPPRPARRRARLPVAAVGIDRGLGGRRSPTCCRATPASRRCSCPTTRTCSRPAARTTTPTSARGTTSAATRTTRGAPGPTRRAIGAPALPAARAAPLARGYDVSRTWFRDEADFPGPRTMTAAADWLDQELAPTRGPAGAGACSSSTSSTRTSRSTRRSRGRSRYDADWAGRAHHLAAVRAAANESARARRPREGRHLRAQYGAKLSMIDHWLGRILDVIDRHDAWGTTAFILCTDHGHYLGERGHVGQAAGAVHPELGHIPLLVAWPGVAPRRSTTRSRPRSTSTRRCATSSASPPSTAPTGTRSSRCSRARRPRRARVGAVRRVGPRSPRGRRHPHLRQGARSTANRPLSMCSNRWSTMPIRALPRRAACRGPTTAAWLDRCPGSDVPVIRQPFDPSDDLPFWAGGAFDGDLLYDRFEADTDRRGPQRRRRPRRQGDDRAARRGAAVDRRPRRAAHPAGAGLMAATKYRAVTGSRRRARDRRARRHAGAVGADRGDDPPPRSGRPAPAHRAHPCHPAGVRLPLRGAPAGRHGVAPLRPDQPIGGVERRSGDAHGAPGGDG